MDEKMTIISAKLYKALKSAGVEEHLAEEASAEVIDLNRKHDELINDIRILNAKFNIMIGIMSATFLMMLGLFIKNIL